MSLVVNRRSLFKSSGAAMGLAASGMGLTSVPLSRAYGAADEPIRLLANENPYGPSQKAKDAMATSLSDGWKYVMGEARTLRKLISTREGVDQSNVIITSGSVELLRMAGLSFGMTGDIVTARPTFPMLAGYARSTGGTVHEIDLDGGMSHDLSSMESRVSNQTSLVYICNPNNPTGTLLDADTLRRFIESVESRAAVLVDEAYVDLLPDPNHNSMIDQVKAGKNVILARTFSKIHGMAGLRIGYAIGRVDLIKRLRPLQMGFLNIMGVRAAIASYQDSEFQSFSKAMIQECISLTQSTFDSLGIGYTRSKANFILFDTGGPIRDFVGAMRKNKILVGRSYEPYNNWCRVSMGTLEQMGIFSEALRSYYKG